MPSKPVGQYDPAGIATKGGKNVIREGMTAVVTGGATAPEFNTGEWRVNVPVLDMDKCKQCLMCVPVCPDSSIPVKNQKREDFDLMHCKGCGICAKVCPFGAITMKEGDE